jgi:hypothetical protein
LLFDGKYRAALDIFWHERFVDLPRRKRWAQRLSNLLIASTQTEANESGAGSLGVAWQSEWRKWPQQSHPNAVQKHFLGSTRRVFFIDRERVVHGGSIRGDPDDRFF